MLFFDSDNLLRFMKMVKCLPEFEYFLCILENKLFFPKLEDQKLQTACSFKTGFTVVSDFYGVL